MNCNNLYVIVFLIVDCPFVIGILLIIRIRLDEMACGGIQLYIGEGILLLGLYGIYQLKTYLLYII